MVGNRVIDGNGDRYIAGPRGHLAAGPERRRRLRQLHQLRDRRDAGRRHARRPDHRHPRHDQRSRQRDQRQRWPVRPRDDAGRPFPGRSGQPDDPRRDRLPDVHPAHRPGARSDDALCPQANRPAVSNPVVDTSGIAPQPNTLVAGEHYRMFRMDSPANVDAHAGCLRTPCADPRQQAPFEIGDYVTFTGNVETDSTGRYISAHTIVASLGIYTQPGVDPAYDTVDVSLIGTGGLTVFGAGEAAARTRFEGMTTDETRQIHVYGVDINPTTGATTDRDWGTILPDPGPAQRRRPWPLAVPPAVHRHRGDAEGVHAAGLRPVHPADARGARGDRGPAAVPARHDHPEPDQPGARHAVGEDGRQRHLLRPVPRPDRGVHLPGERARHADPGEQLQHDAVPRLRWLPVDHRRPGGRPQPVAEQRAGTRVRLRDADHQRRPVHGRERRLAEALRLGRPPTRPPR